MLWLTERHKKAHGSDLLTCFSFAVLRFKELLRLSSSLSSSIKFWHEANNLRNEISENPADISGRESFIKKTQRWWVE